MSTLDKLTIKKYIEEKKMTYTPELGPDQFQPNSIDLRLGFEFYLPKTWKLTENGREIMKVDMEKNMGDNFEKFTLKEGQYFEIAPQEFIVGTTLERIELDCYDIMGILYPRSSINRRGLSVDLTGIIDTGYHGNLFIPIINTTTSQIIRVYPKERFVQIVFHTLTSELSKEESMKHGTGAPKYHQEGQDMKFNFKPDSKN